MNKNKIEEIRKSVEQSPKTAGGRHRYSEAVKTAVRELLADGVKAAELANLTGISPATLFQWSKPRRRKRFRRVEVVTEGASLPGLRIVFPDGVSIECPSIACLKGVLESIR
jgi:hypothetical protein